jgi:hypothetical protein
MACFEAQPLVLVWTLKVIRAARCYDVAIDLLILGLKIRVLLNCRTTDSWNSVEGCTLSWTRFECKERNILLHDILAFFVTHKLDINLGAIAIHKAWVTKKARMS